MEASDVFGGGVEISDGEDPFAGTDFGDFPGEEGQNGGEPVAELPVVDKEGNVVEPPADGASEESQAGEAAQPSTEVETEPEAAPAPAETAAEATPDPTPPPGPAAESAGPTEAEVQETAQASDEQAAGDQGDPTPASSTPQPAAEPTPAESSSESGDEVEDAPEPEETQDPSGRTTKRRYVVLRVDGPGKFTQVDWFVDEEGKMHPTRQPGTRRQAVALARGAEDALKIGYLACGAPTDGVKLVAVAALHFQPKTVKPKPPEPTRQRLSIS